MGKYTSKYTGQEIDNKLDEVSGKQNALEFNGSAPSGVSPTKLSSIYDGTDYFEVPEGLEVIEVSGSSGTLDSAVAARLITNPQNFVIRKTDSAGNMVDGTVDTIKGRCYQLTYISNTNEYIDYSVDIKTTKNNICKLTIEIKTSNNTWSLYTNNGQDKQNKLTFNPTVPSGTTPIELVNLQDGSTYYKITGTPGQDGVTPHIDSTSGNWFIGTTDTGVHAEGPAGQDGSDGADGHSPVLAIDSNGYWTIDGASTGVKAQGPAGQDGTNGTNGQDGVTPHIDSTSGNWFIGSTDTGVHAKGDPGTNGTNGTNGQDGVTPHIDSSSGNWFIGSTDTGVHAKGDPGTNGTNGTNGQDGVTPHIDSSSKHWMIGLTDTGIVAEGQDGQNGTNGTNGQDGVTPHIDSSSGNWFLGSTDTGVHAQGPAGQDGTNGTNGTDGVTPHIDSTSKHWMIGSTDTNIVAEGQNGTNGTNVQDGITPHIDSTSKHWMIGSTDTGVVAEGQTPAMKTLDGVTMTGSGDVKSGKVEQLYIGTLATGLSVLNIATISVKYSHLLIFAHSQYADGYEQPYVISLSEVASTTISISRSIPGWGNSLTAYFFSGTGGDLDWNGGENHIIYASAVFGICKNS